MRKDYIPHRLYTSDQLNSEWMNFRKSIPTAMNTRNRVVFIPAELKNEGFSVNENSSVLLSLQLYSHPCQTDRKYGFGGNACA